MLKGMDDYNLINVIASCYTIGLWHSLAIIVFTLLTGFCVGFKYNFEKEFGNKFLKELKKELGEKDE